MHKNGLILKSLLLIFVIGIFSSCSQGYVRKYSSTKTKRTYKKTGTHSTKVVGLSSKRKMVVSEASKYLGVQYKYGGKSPNTGFDCSGFLTYVYTQSGVKMTGSSSELAKKGKRKSFKNSKAGDLAFFGTNGKVSHVALVKDVGRDRFLVVHATSSKGVRIDDVSKSEYWKKKYLFSRSILN